jgi:hypothetical protein
MESNRSKNRALVSFVGLPMLFLTVALLGGLRVSAEDYAFVFIAPPLVTLLLAVLLALLFVRGRLIDFPGWVAGTNPPLTNISRIWTLLTLFFASAQAFNSVLPERGLLHWLFSFFFLWTLWNNLFSPFDAPRLLRSLVVLFGTAFVLKHLLLASLYSPEGGWLKRVAGLFLQGVSLGTLDTPAFAPASGYISFFTLVLFVAGLFLIPFAQQSDAYDVAHPVLVDNQLKLPPSDLVVARDAIMEDSTAQREPDGALEEGRKQ